MTLNVSTGFALLVLASGVASCGAAQTAPERTPSVRLALEDAPRVGRKAPPIVLPFATAQGIGAADQPFDLARELGNVVVVVFCADDFSSDCTAIWRSLGERADSLFGRGVVVVGVSRDSLATHQRFAQELALPFKLASDPGQAVARRYAATDGKAPRRVVVVVGRDGRVRYVDPQFVALSSDSYIHLASAIAAAKERP